MADIRKPLEGMEEQTKATEMAEALYALEKANQPAIQEGRQLAVRSFSPLPRVKTMERSTPLQPQVIGELEIREAEAILQKYKAGKQALENRVIENEKWFRQRHWDVVGRNESGKPEPASAWLHNSISNKHADAMDNYPSPVVLPREEMDKQSAETLTSILPVVMEQNEYEDTYDQTWWTKLNGGTGIQSVTWDATKHNGIGDISIKEIDVLNLFWEPGLKDLQLSQNVFNVELVNAEVLKKQYPQLEGVAGLAGSVGLMARYAHDESIDDSDKALVVDWYYKRKLGTKSIVHYCKFCAGVLLYASENEPEYAQRGYYDHGQYPFVVDKLFPIKDSIVGFGYVDIMRSPQIYIDKLDQALLMNTVVGATPRYWVKNDGMVNEQEYADMNNPFVHFTGSGNPQDSIFPITPPEMNPYAITLRTAKIDELKETSGNRDFSQGGTTSGITAASAIAALQEAGSKLSRDMIKSAYRAYAKVCYLTIDLMRQFYTAPRMFRITGQQGGMEFVQFSGKQISAQTVADRFSTGVRLPVFDVKVVAQKASPFSTVVQNERAKELYSAGAFAPQMADQALLMLEMMSFEGIENVKQKVAQNSMMMQMQQTILPLTLKMAQKLDAMTGTSYTQGIAQMMQGGVPAAMPAQSGGGMQEEEQANSLGEPLDAGRKSTAGEARKKAAANSTPR